MSDDSSPANPLQRLQARVAKTADEFRPEALAKRHAKGYRSARENLDDLVDESSFVEYGQLAVAAQRSRHDYEELQRQHGSGWSNYRACNY